MRTFEKIEEFRWEAAKALFTTRQALDAAVALLQAELASPQNDARDQAILQCALSKVALSYFDATATETDGLLDSIGVARLTSEDLANALDAILFEAKSLV